MLVEPEVVHISVQYLGVFQQLHACYSDDSGHLSFPGLVQFCVDFRITPSLAPLHYLQATYESVEGIELLESQLTDLDLDVADHDTQLLEVPWQHYKQVRMTGGHNGESEKNVPQRIASKRLADIDSGHYRSGNSQRSNASRVGSKRLADNDGSVERSESSHVMTVNSNLGDGLEMDHDSQNSVPATAAIAQSRQSLTSGRFAQDIDSIVAGKAPVQSVFGVGAFIETLLKVVFVHLGFYGNSVQQSTTGYARAAWLIMYLRYMFTQLHPAYEARSKEGVKSTALHAQLEKVLQTVSDDLWTLPALPNCSLKSTMMQPPLGIGNQGRKLSSSSKAKWARPGRTSVTVICHDPGNEQQFEACVDESICRVCHLQIARSGWGNSACRGCSIVDALPFDEHPFKPLLREWPKGTHPAKLVAVIPVDVIHAALPLDGAQSVSNKS